jgi:hypothetical protein
MLRAKEVYARVIDDPVPLPRGTIVLELRNSVWVHRSRTNY